MPRPNGRDLHREEARQLLETLDLSLRDVPAADVKFKDELRFEFPSPRPCPYPVNNVVHGRLYKCADDWKRKPVVILLHGWNDRMNHGFFFARHARRFNRAGLSAATLQLPWHFDRRPLELGAWGDFLNADALHTVEATLQAVADIRALVNWLVAQGCPFVGIWGTSMGGWLAGLTICHDPRIGAALLSVPVANLDRLIAEVPFCETIRDALRDKQIDFRRLSLVHNRPTIPRENILLIEAEYDLFIAKDIIEDLWRAWGQPEIWRMRMAHLGVLAAPGLSNKVVRWFTAKANAQAGK